MTQDKKGLMMEEPKVYDLNTNTFPINKENGLVSFMDTHQIVNDFKYNSDYGKTSGLASPFMNMTMNEDVTCNEFKRWWDLSKHKDSGDVRIMYVAGLLVPGAYPSMFQSEAIVPSLDTVHTVCVINNRYVVNLHNRKFNLFSSVMAERLVNYIDNWVYAAFQDECSFADFITYIHQPLIKDHKAIEKERFLKLIEGDTTDIDTAYKTFTPFFNSDINAYSLNDLVQLIVTARGIKFPPIDMGIRFTLRDYAIKLSIHDYIEIIAKSLLKEKINLLEVMLTFQTTTSLRYEAVQPLKVKFN